MVLMVTSEKRPDITADRLRWLYFLQGKSWEAIAKELHASKVTIWRKMRKHGIQCRSRLEATSAENHWRWAGSTLDAVCAQCGKAFRKRGQHKVGKYCSQPCYWKNKQQDLPAAHRRFLGSKEWKILASRARERDNYVCIDCGMSNEEHLSRGWKALDVHHIQPRHESESRKLDLSNVATLCNVCHIRRHKGV